MTDDNLGMVVVDTVKNSDGEESSRYGLSYNDFIALNTWQIQKLKSRVSELEARLEALEQK